jgi:hypothetical protein
LVFHFINPYRKSLKSSNSIMKQGKKNLTLVVLALEIATIVILHAIKINQSERPTMATEKEAVSKEVSRNAAVHAYTRLRSSYTLASLK